MSISSLLFDIKSKIFKSESNSVSNDYVPDLEAGEGGFYKRLKARQVAFELASTPYAHNLADINSSEELDINIDIYDQPKIIENFAVFLDVVNYFVIKRNKKDYKYKTYDLPFVISDIHESLKNENELQRNENRKYSTDHVEIEILDDENVELFM